MPETLISIDAPEDEAGLPPRIPRAWRLHHALRGGRPPPPGAGPGRDTGAGDAGTGRPAPVVLVHGFGCAGEDWAPQVEALSPERVTLTLDLPMHGASRPASEFSGEAPPLTIEACSRALGALLDALALPPAVLVGHSMGCRVVMQCALERPRGVRGLVLVDGSRIGNGDPEALSGSPRRGFGQEGYEAATTRLFREMFLPATPEERIRPFVERALRLPSATGLALFASMAAWDAGRALGALEAIRAPLAVVQSTWLDTGRRRIPLGPGESTPWVEEIRRMRPDARIELVPGAGHFTMLDAPEAVTRAIRALATDGEDGPGARNG